MFKDTQMELADVTLNLQETYVFRDVNLRPGSVTPDISDGTRHLCSVQLHCGHLRKSIVNSDSYYKHHISVLTT